MIEFLRFLKIRKKLWMAPLIGVFFIIGFALIAVKGSVFAPFIYTLF